MSQSRLSTLRSALGILLSLLLSAAPSFAADATAPDDASRACNVPHPHASAFAVVFKATALVAYLLLTLFFDSFVLIFVVCVTLLSLDFWTVKNVSGRLLVGLRWWNEVRDDGTSEWHFESREVRVRGTHRASCGARRRR